MLLSCSLSRCSSVKLRLSSLFLSLSHFLCLSLSLYSKLEDIINKISKLRNCAVLNRYEKFIFLLGWLRWSFQLFMLHETRAALCFRAKNYALKDYPKFCIGLPVVRTDGRSVGRSVGHVITKFSGMGRFIYPWCSAGALRARSSANNNDNNSINQLSQKIVPESFDAFFLNLCNFKNFKSRRMSTDHNKITFATKYLRMSQVR